MLAKIFAALREEGVTKADIAAMLAVHAEEIDQLVFGLVLTALSSSNGSQAVSSKSRPDLRLVHGGGSDNS